jgi:pyruvate/oxaloacetate carboxyltransferase
MLSNLESQLKEQKALSKLDAVLDEVSRVRKDLGYPPLGTPVSQIIGVQSTLNVLLEKRYKIITKETREYIKGMYGTPPGDIDKDLMKVVLASEKRIECRPADLLAPQLGKFRKEAENFAQNDEDLLTYALFPQIAEGFLKKKYGISG